MNYFGLIIGLVMLFATGLGHIIVIKGEYYFGIGLWPIFLIIGIIFAGLSLFVSSNLLSAIFAIFSAIFLWGIHELIKQKDRVNKGWFPKRKQ